MHGGGPHQGMFAIDLTFDCAAFDKSARALEDESIVPDLVDTVNDFGGLAIKSLVEAQANLLDRPKPFIQKGWVRGRTKRGPNGSAVGDVHLLPIQAQYLTHVIDGGIRRAGDYATTALGPLVPGRDAQLHAYGNLPRGYVERMLRYPEVAWVHLPLS